eukprot:scaffold6789_cov115-Isochrysis_galbana.AAC.5
MHEPICSREPAARTFLRSVGVSRPRQSARSAIRRWCGRAVAYGISPLVRCSSVCAIATQVMAAAAESTAGSTELWTWATSPAVGVEPSLNRLLSTLASRRKRPTREPRSDTGSWCSPA